MVGMNSETNAPKIARGIARPTGTPTATITPKNPSPLIAVSRSREYRYPPTWVMDWSMVHPRRCWRAGLNQDRNSRRILGKSAAKENVDLGMVAEVQKA